MTKINKVVRTMQGTVVSNKMDKTIVVLVVRKVKHPLYGKYIKRSTKLYAHDEKNVAQPGDLVVVRQTRPISRTKQWSLVEVVKHAPQQVEKKDLEGDK